MGKTPWLLLVICQMVNAVSFENFGKATPIQPTPLSTLEDSPIINTPLEWNCEDIISEMFASTGTARGFSTPITLSTTSSTLPVPRIEIAPIATNIDCNIYNPELIFSPKNPYDLTPKILPETWNVPKLYDTTPDFIKSNYYSLDSPQLSSDSNESLLSLSANTSPTSCLIQLPSFDFISPNTYVSNKWKQPFTKLALPIINSLPIVPIEPLERHIIDPFTPSPIMNNNMFSLLSPQVLRPTIYTTDLTLDSPPMLEVPPSLIETSIYANPFSPTNIFNTNTLSLSNPMYSLPYPLYYKSMYLPRVRTPSSRIPLQYGPFPYTGINSNILYQSGYQDLLSTFREQSQISDADTSEFISPYLNPIKVSDISNSFNTVRIPKVPSTLPVFSAQNAVFTNPWLPCRSPMPFAAVVFESKIVKPNPLIPSIDICGNDYLPPLLSSIPYTMEDDLINSYSPDFSSLAKPKISYTIPKKSIPLLESTVPVLSSEISGPPDIISISLPDLEVNPLSFEATSFELPNCMNNFDTNVGYSNDFAIPNMFPTVDAFVNNMNTDITHCLPNVDIIDIPSFKQRNIPDTFTNPLIPDVSNFQLPSLLEERTSSNFAIPNMFHTVDAFVNNMNNDITYCLPNVDVIDVPNFEQRNIPETFTNPLIPDVSNFQLPSLLEECTSNNPLFSAPTESITLPITSQTPTTSISYVNVTPSSSLSQSSSNMVSSLNNVVSNITQNILSSYLSYLESEPKTIDNIPKYRPKPNTRLGNKLRSKQILAELNSLSPINVSKLKTSLPKLSQSMASISSPIDIPKILPPQEPIIHQTSVKDTLNSIPSSSLEFTKVNALPLTSSITYSTPQLCPSYLPSPSLPLDPVISLPFLMESPIIKANPSEKDPKSLDKLLKLMVLAELLKDNENFHWDDLDTLLAFLSMT